jgi:RNA polymerase sigma-70 factor (ECF subfamily)
MVPVSRLSAWLGQAALRVGRPADGEDWRLWRAACAGEPRAAARLVALLAPQAHGLAMQLLGRSEDAEDVVQDAFMRLWRSTPSDEGSARLSTYFNTIVINRCRSLLAGRREQATDEDELHALHDAWQLRDTASDTDEAADAHDRPAQRERLAAALARLPARQRMAAVMWAYADASVAEIGHTLNLDPNAAHQLLYRARQALRKHLDGGSR